MRIGLLDRQRPYYDRRREVTVIHGHELLVVDDATGEPVENVAAMAWGPGSLLTRGADEGIFTPEHLDEEADYLILAIPCAAARRV